MLVFSQRPLPQQQHHRGRTLQPSLAFQVRQPSLSAPPTLATSFLLLFHLFILFLILFTSIPRAQRLPRRLRRQLFPHRRKVPSSPPARVRTILFLFTLLQHPVTNRLETYIISSTKPARQGFHPRVLRFPTPPPPPPPRRGRIHILRTYMLQTHILKSISFFLILYLRRLRPLDFRYDN